MVDTTLADNINVSNAVILSILNGTVLFTHVEPVIKRHPDMHQKHVKDVFTMMESADMMILMDTMTATSLESVELHMLFTYVYLFNFLNRSRTTSLCHHFFFPLSFKHEQTFINIMFLPPTSILKPIIYPFANKFYPPAILVKHHVWFLPAADLFISLDGILYSVDQSYFDQSPLFQGIICYGEANGIGTNPYYPIPFNTLKKKIFNDFLHLLYFGVEQLEQLPWENWINIKRLSMDWHFPHVTTLII
jgi:hypothetical protein